MHQGDLFGRQPVIEGPLPPVKAPYQPSSETSKQGAQKAEQFSAALRTALARIYEREGPLTDWEAADALSTHFGRHIERTTVIPRRHELMRSGFLEKKGTRVNTVSGVANTIYGVRT